jgi:hypothetical protein
VAASAFEAGDKRAGTIKSEMKGRSESEGISASLILQIREISDLEMTYIFLASPLLTRVRCHLSPAQGKSILCDGQGRKVSANCGCGYFKKKLTVSEGRRQRHGNPTHRECPRNQERGGKVARKGWKGRKGRRRRREVVYGKTYVGRRMTCRGRMEGRAERNQARNGAGQYYLAIRSQMPPLHPLPLPLPLPMPLPQSRSLCLYRARECNPPPLSVFPSRVSSRACHIANGGQCGYC